ncbi:hypothetical protein [Streptomyces sp. 1222.5]|uniref:hypothetical protein n=1 Tax=Streptomyces sp. 1222.5 TaxID=1881026 RepID=UPI003D734EE1
MPDQPMGFPGAAPGPFDLATANDAVGKAVAGLLTMTLRPRGSKPDPAEAVAVMNDMREAIMAAASACAEITRMRAELTSLRDSHRPQPHADPTKPGALCAACSVQGSIIAWPCGAWSSAERILNHGKA